MTTPTRQEIKAAHEALDYLYACACKLNKQGEQAERVVAHAAIMKILPPTSRSTMADVNWEHCQHFLTVAESTRDEERYIMLCPEMSEHIRCISEDPHRSTEVILREYLVPTDDKNRLNWEML